VKPAAPAASSLAVVAVPSLSSSLFKQLDDRAAGNSSLRRHLDVARDRANRAARDARPGSPGWVRG